MTAAILLINLVFCLILAGTGWFLYKKHSAWPDTSAGYHHRAAMESRGGRAVPCRPAPAPGGGYRRAADRRLDRADGAGRPAGRLPARPRAAE